MGRLLGCWRKSSWFFFSNSLINATFGQRIKIVKLHGVLLNTPLWRLTSIIRPQNIYWVSRIHAAFGFLSAFIRNKYLSNLYQLNGNYIVDFYIIKRNLLLNPQNPLLICTVQVQSSKIVLFFILFFREKRFFLFR